MSPSNNSTSQHALKAYWWWCLLTCVFWCLFWSSENHVPRYQWCHEAHVLFRILFDITRPCGHSCSITCFELGRINENKMVRRTTLLVWMQFASLYRLFIFFGMWQSVEHPGRVLTMKLDREPKSENGKKTKTNTTACTTDWMHVYVFWDSMIDWPKLYECSSIKRVGCDDNENQHC